MDIGMKDHYLENLCDEIDAAIFSGDKISIKENRDMLSDFIGRWTRAIENEEMQATEDPSSVVECLEVFDTGDGLGVFQCTLPAGHDGPHIAGGPDGEEYQRWEN